MGRLIYVREVWYSSVFFGGCVDNRTQDRETEPRFTSGGAGGAGGAGAPARGGLEGGFGGRGGYGGGYGAQMGGGMGMQGGGGRQVFVSNVCFSRSVAQRCY